MQRKRLPIALFTGLLLYFSAVVYLYQSSYEIVHTWTLAIRTPHNELIYGSSNIAYQATNAWTIFDRSPRYTTALFGEIPFVQLNDGQLLFLRALDRPPLPFVAFRDDQELRERGLINHSDRTQTFELMRSHKHKIYLKRRNYPGFFILRDFQESRSITTFATHELDDFLPRGYQIESVSLQLSTEGMSDGQLLDAMPWLDSYYAEREQQGEYGLHQSNEFDRIDVRRFRECLLPDRLARALSLGFYEKGIACSLRF